MSSDERFEIEWRKSPMTERQKGYIEEMREMSEFPLPEFSGSTKGEAADYIDRYIKMAHESSWGIENGY